jgi:hypothetical protein
MPGVTTKIRRRQARAFAYKSDCPQGREFRPATPQDPHNSFFNKPVLLFATGGLPAQVAVLERALRHELLRLGTTTIAAKVHIGSGNWITVGNDRPRLSRGAETEIAYSIEIVLRGIRLKECKDFSRELAER